MRAASSILSQPSPRQSILCVPAGPATGQRKSHSSAEWMRISTSRGSFKSHAAVARFCSCEIQCDSRSSKVGSGKETSVARTISGRPTAGPFRFDSFSSNRNWIWGMAICLWPNLFCCRRWPTSDFQGVEGRIFSCSASCRSRRRNGSSTRPSWASTAERWIGWRARRQRPLPAELRFEWRGEFREPD